MARGDNIATSVPSVGASETGGTSDILTILTALVTIAETKVTPSEVDMDATLDFNSQAGENVKYIEFVTQSTSGGNETLYTKNVTRDELFYQDSSGTEVQITSNGSLNVAATGSVTGAGYGSGGVAVNWNSAGNNYQMKSGSGADDYAAVTMAGLQLRDGSSHTLTMEAASMSANDTVTWPASVSPTNTNVLTLANSGQMAVGGDWQIDSGDTQTVASGGSITVASGGELNLTDYADLVHGEIQKKLFPFVADNTTWGTDFSGIVTNTTTSGSQRLSYPLGLRTGDRIKSFTLLYATNANPDTVTLDLREAVSGSDSSVESTTTSSTGTVTFTLVTPYALLDDKQYYLKVTHTGTSGSDHQINAVFVTYDRI